MAPVMSAAGNSFRVAACGVAVFTGFLFVSSPASATPTIEPSADLGDRDGSSETVVANGADLTLDDYFAALDAGAPDRRSVQARREADLRLAEKAVVASEGIDRACAPVASEGAPARSTTKVPEPRLIAMLALGLLSLFGGARLRR